MTSGLDRVKGSASLPSLHFTPGETTPGSHWTVSLVVLRASLDTEAGGKIFSASARDWTSIAQSLVRQYTDWATPAPSSWQSQSELVKLSTEMAHQTYINNLHITLYNETLVRKNFFCNWILKISYSSPKLNSRYTRSEVFTAVRMMMWVLVPCRLLSTC
jgi:hypothetical protein